MRGIKKVGLLIWIITGWIAAVDAQPVSTPYVVTGIIRDSVTTKPIAYATISVFDTANKIIASSYSLESGTFKTVMPQKGMFTLEISFVGYKTRELEIRIDQPTKEMGILFLSPGNDYLQEVSVTARRRLVDQKPGMLVYNAENDPTNKGGTAADVLRKAPILNVDAQGNVSMRGSSNLKILVNGKYSGQMARSTSDALNMMPASMIKSIEIITTPSAKYDAEGAAGVINIITVKGKGVTGGTLEVSASNLEQMLNPRFTYSNTKWDINFAGHIHRLRRKSEDRTDRTNYSGGTETSRLQQIIESDNAAPHGSFDLGVGYIIDKSSELSLGITAWLGNWPQDSRTGNIMSNPGGVITEQYFQSIASTQSYLGADINLAYTRQFRKPGQQITLQLQGSPSRDLSDYDAPQVSIDKELIYREINNSKTSNREWTIQADYVHPLNTKGKYILETGVKVILRNVGNQYDVLASDSTDVYTMVPQTGRSDNFKYSQDVIAGYSMLRMNLTSNWYLEAGARVEATYIQGNFVHKGTAFDNRFVNFVPTATLSKKLDESNTLNLSYTKRITRPYIWDLNPNVDASDPKNLESGNPHLQPEISHQAELSYGLNTGKALFVNAAIFWKQTDNAIVEYMETNAAGISLTSKQNLAANRQFGFNLSTTANLSEKWTANGNININYFDYNSEALAIMRTGWGSEINISTTYKLPKHFSIQAFGEYNNRQVTLMGEQGRMYYYSFAGKKEIKKARMVVTLSTVNLFNTYVAQAEKMQRPTFISVTDNRYYNRAIKLTLSWEFGGTHIKQKEIKKIENSDINVQGKG